MLRKDLPLIRQSGVRDAPLFQAGWNFCGATLLLLAATLVLCACAPVQKEQNAAYANAANYYLPNLPELVPASEAWRQEPSFTQKEVGAFVRDLQSIQTMNARDTVNYLLRDRGWTQDRLRYLDRKTALLVTAINSGSLENLSQEGPYFLPPTREEIAAVQKYYPVLNNMLKNNMLNAREPVEE